MVAATGWAADDAAHDDITAHFGDGGAALGGLILSQHVVGVGEEEEEEMSYQDSGSTFCECSSSRDRRKAERAIKKEREIS